MSKGFRVKAKFPKVFKPLDKPHRYKMIWGGRGKGASWTVARKLLIRGTEKPLRILCTRELQKSIQQSVHKLLSDQIEKLSLQGFYEVQKQGIFGKNGTEIFFIGVKANPDEIKSMEGIDICWIEEAHALSETSWDIIDPTIRKDGSEIWATWNTRFKFDCLHTLFVINKAPPDALVLNVNYPDNPYFPEVLRKQMEHMKENDYEKYLNVWMGELKQLAEGAIFGKQVTALKKDKRLLYIPIEKNCEVHTFFDLGKNDQTAIWFMQRVGMEYRFIDYFEGRLEDIEYYTRFIKKMDYLYGAHYLPHDADHDRLGMVKNIKEQFEAIINPIEIVPRTPDKTAAIQLARDSLAKSWFHKRVEELPDTECEGYYECDDPNMTTRHKRVERGFETLCNYRYKYNDENKVFGQNPHHDWASNGADAFMQFAQGFIEDTSGWGKELTYPTRNRA